MPLLFFLLCYFLVTHVTHVSSLQGDERTLRNDDSWYDDEYEEYYDEDYEFDWGNYDDDGRYTQHHDEKQSSLRPYPTSALQQTTTPETLFLTTFTSQETTTTPPPQETTEAPRRTDVGVDDDFFRKFLFFGSPGEDPTETPSHFRGDLPPSLDSEEDEEPGARDFLFNQVTERNPVANSTTKEEDLQSLLNVSQDVVPPRDPVFILPVVDTEVEDSGILNFTDGVEQFLDGQDVEETTRTPEKETTTGVTITASTITEEMNSWVWFFITLSGSCHRVNFSDVTDLISDFVASFSSLLLYDREHVTVQSMSCANDRLTVNMSVDSAFYPNCEKDLETLLSHKNIRVRLHNSSFSMESFDTKRSLIFETKPEMRGNHPNVLLFTLGAVGISLLCLLIAGVIFAVYQCARTSKASSVVAKYEQESPRSLRPKFESDQGAKSCERRPHGVNMYRSYSDLSAPDLYSHLGSFDSTGSARSEMSVAPPTTHMKISMEKKKKRKKKNKMDYEDSGLSDIAGYEEMWSESLTETSEDYMTIRNLNTKASTFRAEVKECEKDSLDPLLRNIDESTPDGKQSQATPTTESIESSANCPSPPAVRKDVLKSLDDLISNSNPDINSFSAYSATYSNTTINISSASSAIFSTTNTSSYPPTDSSPMTYTSTNTSSFGTTEGKQSSTTSASAENLCLTRITFMGMENPSFRIETDM